MVLSAHYNTRNYQVDCLQIAKIRYNTYVLNVYERYCLMSIIAFVAVFVVFKFVVTWVTIMSLITLFSPSTAWKIRVLWGRLRGKLSHIPEQPPTWNRQVRIGSLITFPICLIVLAFFVRSLLPVLT